MSVVSVDELFSGRKASQDDKRVRKYTRLWEVRTDDPFDDETIVYAGAGLPAIGARYVTPNASDLGAFVVGIDASQNEIDPTLWLCTANYESRTRIPGSGGTVNSDGQGGNDPVTPGNVDPDPLARPPVYKGGTQKAKALVTQALNPDGDLVDVLNTAGQPYVPAIEADRGFPVVTVTINKPLDWLNLVTLYGPNGYDDSVNLTTWKGLPPRTVRIDNIEWEEAFENDTSFLKVTWQLAVNFETWDFVVANVGFYQLTGDGSDDSPWGYEKYVDPNGREPTDPVPLDVNGHFVTPGTTPILTQKYRYYRELEFSGVVP
jgi:hypothetical protein